MCFGFYRGGLIFQHICENIKYLKTKFEKDNSDFILKFNEVNIFGEDTTKWLKTFDML